MPKYEYKGYKFESDHHLSDEEFATTLSHLDTLPPKQEQDKGPSLLDKGIGLGQAAASVLTGAAGAALAPIPTALQAANAYASGKGKDFNFEQQLADNMGAMTYEPSRELGQEYAQHAGEFINRNLIPLAPIAHGIPGIRPGEAVNAMRSKFNREVPSDLAKKQIPIGDAALKELLAKEQESSVEMFKQAALERQKAALEAARLKGQQPIAVDTQGQAAMQATNGPFERLSPMESMARSLGADKAVEEAPMSRLASDLTEFRSTKEQRAAQEAIDLRQAEMEREVAQKTSLEQNAKARGEQEAASPYSSEELAKKQAREAEAKAAEVAKQDPAIKAYEEALAEKKKAEAGKTRLPETPVFELAPNGKMRIKVEELAKQELPKPTTMESAVTKISEGKPFALGAEERIIWEKTKTAIQRIEGGLKALSNKEVLSKVMDRQWVDQAIQKIKQQQEMFDQIAKSSLDRKAVLDANKRRELLTQDLEALETTLNVRPDTSSKLQGPKTREAKRREMMGPPGQRGRIRFSWGDNGKLEPLKNVPGLGERLKDVGNALIKNADEAIALAKDAKDVAQNVVQQGFNQLTKGGLYLKQRVNNPVVHFAVDRITKADDLARADISKLLHGDYLGKIRKLTSDEYKSTHVLLNAADLTEKTITPEFMAKHNLPMPMREAIEAHQKLMGDALDRINTVRTALGKKPMTAREAYSAMSIRGDFRKAVFKTVDGEKRVVGSIGADVLKGKVGWTLDKIEQHMAAKDPALEFGPLQDRTKFNQMQKASPHEAFNDTLQIIGENNPHMAEFLQNLRDVAKEDTKHYMGMDAHMMQKKGVWGAEGRKPWLSEMDNARQFFDNQAKYLENTINWGHLTEAATEVSKVLSDEGVLKTHPNAVAMAEQYMNKSLGVDSVRMGKAAGEWVNSVFRAVNLGPGVSREVMSMTKKTVNTMLLSLNPMFLAIQVLQAPMVMPGMAAFLRGRGLAPSSTWLSQGLGHYAQGHMTWMKVLAKAELTKTEREAVEYAKKNHIAEDDMIEHSNATRKDVGYYTTKVTQSPMAKVEVATRMQVYMAIVHMLDDSGLKAKDGLYEQAHRFLDLGMNRPSQLEKPRMYEALGPIGNAAYNLSSYKHNELSRWAMYAREIGKSGNPVPLLTQMATTLSMAGVMGLPFFSAASKLYDEITEMLGKPRSLVLDTMEASEAVGKHLGPNGKFFLSNGAMSTFGVDASRRLGMGDALPGNLMDAAMPGSSKLVDMVGSAGNAMIHPTKPEYWQKAAYDWAPPIAQGPMDVSMFQKGTLAYTKNPDNLHPTAERNARDVLLRKIGLMGVNESTQKAKYYEQGQITKKYADLRTKAMNAMAQDMFHDRDIKESAMKYLKAEGDPSTFEKDLQALALSQNIAPEKYKIMRDAMSGKLNQLADLQRRVKQ